jgi:Tol biopolymer transport system component
MDIWVGDAAASRGKDVVQRARVSVERLQWSGDRLLYGAVASAKPGVFRLAPGEATPEVVLSEALAPAVTSDGALVFVSSQDMSLWKADANGRRIAQLAGPVTAEPVAVTADDRFALYTALTSGSIAIWMVPLAGGAPTKLADGNSVDASPAGESVAFIAPDANNRLAIVVVCRLPACDSRRQIGRVSDDRSAVRWTPDGSGVAYAEKGNLWVQSLDGGPLRQLTRFTDGRPIMSFAWSRDGKRLAIARTSTTDDIVLIKGLK